MTIAAPSASAPRRRKVWTVLRLLLGTLLVAGLGYFLWTPGDWANKVLVWVLLTLLADECGGWFGYIALALGALVFFAPGATPEQWFAAFPLLLGALFATLMVKHSGGPFVLPFAAALFGGAVLAAPKLGEMLDTPIKVLATNEFRRMALLPAAVALVFSFVRQLVGMTLEWQRRRRAHLLAQAQAAAPAPELPAPQAPNSSAEMSASERVVSGSEQIVITTEEAPPNAQAPSQK